MSLPRSMNIQEQEAALAYSARQEAELKALRELNADLQRVHAANHAKIKESEKWRRYCGTLLAQIDYLIEATGEDLGSPDDVALVAQIRADLRS